MRSASPQLEICAETPQACSAAFEGGAHRIEICSALGNGGVTPSHGLIRAAIDAANGLPVYVLLRPRAGNFLYSDAEFRILCADLEDAASLGVSGFTTGMLTEERTVDEPRMRELVKLAGGKEITFHRAFDHTENLSDALEQVIAAGCRRVLTSGGRPTVGEGMDTIADLARQAAGRVRVAAGGGVTPGIAAALRHAGNVDLHVSLRRGNRLPLPAVDDPLWTNGDETGEISVADVQHMVSILMKRVEHTS